MNIIPKISQLSPRVIRILGMKHCEWNVCKEFASLIMSPIFRMQSWPYDSTRHKHVPNRNRRKVLLYWVLILSFCLIMICFFSRRILLDTGDGQEPEYFDILKSVLKEQKATIEHIVLSHWHPDHIGGVEGIQKSLTSSNCSNNITICINN